MRIITLGGVAAIVLLVVGVLLVEEGEVVTLETVDEQGRRSETGLWIVDIEGTTYLRAGKPDSEWFDRLRAHPEVALERGGVVTPVRAVPIGDPAMIAAVNRAMREKYGFVDAVALWLIDHSRATAVRVEPREVASRVAP